MNSKNHSQAYSQVYSEEQDEQVLSLTNMEIKWLNLLKRISRDDLEVLRRKFEKQRQQLLDIKKKDENHNIEQM
ncbi:unnamed protein product [Paramecium primaurelia]|uniref:Uncharacterized protein n=1 Tax=Paramecium primaurelia TaxID=5886 RepID=A0A8S1MCU0_PARPR|nr:unnamed protein product [Paramecium primaurelia]